MTETVGEGKMPAMLVVPRLLTTLAVLAAGAALIVALAWLFQRKTPVSCHPPRRLSSTGFRELR